METKNIMYVGLHPETLLILCKERVFHIAATSQIEAFSTVTANPVNIIFILLYRLRRKNQLRAIEVLLLLLWSFLKIFSTSIYSKYKDYVQVLSRNKISILDFSKKSLVLDYIKSNNIDLLVVNLWGILPEEIIFASKHGAVNIHPSKLPQYRGALPTLWSLKNNDKQSAVTYIKLDEAVDNGSIISQHIFEISSDDDWLSIELKINKIIEKTLITVLRKYLDGQIKPYPQHLERISYTGKYYEYMSIDWLNEAGKDIYNKVNLYPFIEPNTYCYTFLNERKILFKKTTFMQGIRFPKGLKFGQFSIKGFSIMVSAKDGFIKAQLFFGLRFKDSFFILLKRKGIFGGK